MVQAALASMLGFGQVASREKSVSSHVPYLRHVDEQTLRTKDGLFVTSIKLDGFCFQTADQSEINQRLSTRNTLIRAMNDSRFAVYSHIIRREVRPEIGGILREPLRGDDRPQISRGAPRQADVRQRPLSHRHPQGVSGQDRVRRQYGAELSEGRGGSRRGHRQGSALGNWRKRPPISSTTSPPMARGC